MKLKAVLAIFSALIYTCTAYGQDLSEGLSVINDTSDYSQQAKAKPAYLDTIIDPSFGTVIRRITDVGSGSAIVPLHSSIQAWNTDESMMILYDQSNSVHQLLHGKYYYFIRNLDDIQPDDIEELFWDFNEPEILYYLEDMTDDFIRYNVVTQSKEILVNLDDIVADCTGAISMGNAIQMMSWDSDVVGFRCNNDATYSYRISTGELTEFVIEDVNWEAPMPAPSGNLFYHQTNVYNSDGSLHLTLNENESENSCLGKLPNGDDARFTVTFSQSPDGGCEGNIVAHNLVTGECFEVIGEGQGYLPSQIGTDISALAHKNTEGGWLAASIAGFDQDGQSLLDQEIVIAKAEQGDIKVCRIAHHRGDRDEFDPWGAPRATISPSGTRVLFASDWSGVDDGQSVECYVVELPTYGSLLAQSDPPVYPGDCNMDGQVSADDAIYINLALGSSLLPRPNASTDWIPQLAYDSGDSIQGIDLKYIDADGNGLIDTLDLAVIVQNFDNAHTEGIVTVVGTVLIDPTNFTYESTQDGTFMTHRYTYHFEKVDMTSSVYGSSLSFDYDEFESVVSIEVMEENMSPDVNVLFTHNDTTSKDFYVVNQLIDIDEYDMEIVIIEDMASTMTELNMPDNGISLKANNTPEFHLNNQIIVNEEGEKFQVEHSFVTYILPTETTAPFRLAPTLLTPGNPIFIHADVQAKTHIQFIDIQGKIHHQFSQQLQMGNNMLTDASAQLPKGMYFVRIIDGGNYFYTYKIIVI